MASLRQRLVAKPGPVRDLIESLLDPIDPKDFYKLAYELCVAYRQIGAQIVSNMNVTLKSLLGFERIFLGSPKLPEYGLLVLESLARARGLLDDPVFNDRFMSLKLDVAHLADIYGHYAAIVARGESLGQDVSLLKIWASETFQRVADLVVETAGPLGGLSGDVSIGEDKLNLLATFYKARVPTIYGGTSEIQRNILARQVLELPG